MPRKRSFSWTCRPVLANQFAMRRSPLSNFFLRPMAFKKPCSPGSIAPHVGQEVDQAPKEGHFRLSRRPRLRENRQSGSRRPPESAANQRPGHGLQFGRSRVLPICQFRSGSSLVRVVTNRPVKPMDPSGGGKDSGAGTPCDAMGRAPLTVQPYSPEDPAFAPASSSSSFARHSSALVSCPASGSAA